MAAPSPKTIQRRLERAGYVHVAGWVPAAYAQRVVSQIDAHRDEVEQIAAEPPLPRGRQPKKPS